MRNIMKNEDGFTGLEAAIVLIAFIVVAAVFSYVVLGAGFFTTQKSQEVVHTGVSQTSSSVEVVGKVYGISTTTPSTIQEIRFDLGLTAGGSPVDMKKTVMTYSKSGSSNPIYLDYNGGGSTPTANTKWAIVSDNDGDGDALLERGEIFTILVKIDDTGDETRTIAANEQMRLEVRPPVGAVLGLQRTAPPQIDRVNVLY